jgi:hypothetical protein
MKRLSTCDLVLDSDRLRMFAGIRARMATMALLDENSHVDGVPYFHKYVYL